MDTGLLILRAVVGLLLVGHGTQKLVGWFGGDGLGGTAGYLESLGYRPGRPFALLSGVAEAGGGALLALGLGGPLAAAALVANMVNAARGHAGKGVWNDGGGWELPLVFGAAAAALGFTGYGAHGLDHALSLDLAGVGWGLAALAAGLTAGLATGALRRDAPAGTAAPTTA